jgi:hypothetical protein
MNRHNIKHSLGLLLGLLLSATLPAAARADWLGFRNDTKQTLIVRTIIQTEKGPRPGNVVTLFPGEVRWDLIRNNTPLQIQIFDAKQPRKNILEKVIPAPVGADAYYSIQVRMPPQVPAPTLDLVKQPGRRR